MATPALSKKIFLAIIAFLRASWKIDLYQIITSLNIVEINKQLYSCVQIDLELHKGFLGGLQQNKTTGDTAPYYATPTCEIVYHVSTRIPSGSEESRHIKVCNKSSTHSQLRFSINFNFSLIWVNNLHIPNTSQSSWNIFILLSGSQALSLKIDSVIC